VGVGGRFEEWGGRSIVILGLARQGKALARYLAQQGAHVVVSDIKPAEQLVEQCAELAGLDVAFALGGHPLALLEGADILCLSGGVPAQIPLVGEAHRRGIPVSNDAQIFLQACPAAVIGITGSAGKTTTTALVGEMAAAYTARQGGSAWVGGNIGNPLISDLERIQPSDVVVMELSSFQLEVMTISPHVAAVLNITPNHLDRHGTMQAYTEAKARILAYQAAADVAVLGYDDPGAWALRSRVRGRCLSFGRGKPPEGEGAYLSDGQIWLSTAGEDAPICRQDEVQLRGEHNLLNAAAACAIAAAADLTREAMVQGIRAFRGLPHRLEFVRRVGGVDWYNDSIATAPERSIAAIRAFTEPLVLLAGGRDKDLPWDEFAEVVCQRVDHLILFGEAGQKILRAVEGACAARRPETVEVQAGLEGAVSSAARIAQPGDVVLLAPGGTSFDEFQDFEARGNRFKQMVQSL
jgi:UDP-N-acetylmuramoylalanine--D-glutamate ligase